MDFFSYLENIRKEPEHIRKNVAFWVSAGVTFLVLLIWISFLTLSPLGTSQEASVKEAQMQKAQTPKTIINQLQAGIEALIGQFK